MSTFPKRNRVFLSFLFRCIWQETVRPDRLTVAAFLRKVGKAMVQIKRDWFDTALENYERGETHGRWKEKIQV